MNNSLPYEEVPDQTVPNSQPEFKEKSKLLLNIKFFFFNFKKSRFVMSSGIVILVLFLLTSIVAASATLTVYTNLNVPILSKYKPELSALFYKIPLLPRTKDQILLVSLESSKNIKTYKNDTSISIETTNSALGNASLAFTASGNVDVSNLDNPSFSQSFSLSATLFGQPMSISSSFVMKDYEAFIKIDDVSENILNFLTAFLTSEPIDQSVNIKERTKGVFAHWIKVTDQSLSNEIRESARKAQKTNDEDVQIFKRMLSDERIMSKITKKQDERINSISSYHLQLQPDQEFLEVLYDYISSIEDEGMSISKDEFAKIVDDYEYIIFDFWIGKNDRFITKISIQAKANLEKFSAPSIPNLEQTGQIQMTDIAPQNNDEISMIINASSTFSDFNKDIQISLPENSITPEEFMNLFSSTFQPIPDDINNVKSSFDHDLSVIREGVNKYYVASGKFPDTLSQLFGTYIPSYNSLSNDISNYSYRRGSDHYVVFTTFQNQDPFGFDSDSPYYGFSSRDGIVRQLSIYEINPE